MPLFITPESRSARTRQSANTRTAATLTYAILVAAAWSVLPLAAQTTEEGIWTKRPNGWAHHVQSGFACPPTLVSSADKGKEMEIRSLSLESVIVGEEGRARGTHVGCEYGGKDGTWASIEIVKMEPNESVDDFKRSTRKKIMEKYPTAAESRDMLEWVPKSPTNGRTYATGYTKIRVGDRPASIVVVGGEVDDWMITLILFDYSEETVAQKMLSSVSWHTIARSRAVQ